MSNLLWGFTLGVLVGSILGHVACLLVMTWAMLVGRITTRDIADACDRLLDSHAEQADEPKRRKVL